MLILVNRKKSDIPVLDENAEVDLLQLDFLILHLLHVNAKP